MKKILSLLLVLAMTLSLAACGPNESAADTQTAVSEESGQEDAQEETAEDAGGTEDAASEESAEEDASQTAYPVTVTDQAGREVVIEEEPQKLVSGYYISTSLLIALGLEDRLVGIEAKADTRPVYQLSAPELLELPSVGTAKEFDLEGCAALEPDLVLMPVKLQDYAATLEDLGITVLVVNPESQELLEEMLTLIATACGVSERAEALLAYYEEQLTKVSDLTAGEEKPRVYVASNSSYLSAAPGLMYQSDLVTLAGGENVMAQLPGDYWTEVSYESILAADPEVIVIPAGAEYTTQDVLNDENLAQITAVKNAAVYAMPQNLEEWDSPIPSGILGVLWLTSVLHPQVYDFETFQQDAQDFYKTFYGVEIPGDLITK